MRSRFLRLVTRSVIEAAPARARSLTEVDLERYSATLQARKGSEVPDALALMSVKELVDRDEAIFLLHSAAEVEHSLMVQYLFAATSLEFDQAKIAGTNVPADAAGRQFAWFRTILEIAKQEMAHLLTVQNILRALGGPLNFEREDFPFRSDLYPYPFELRPLTKTSLARYVAAEMPETPPAGTEAVVEEILERIADGSPVTNRVGTLYAKLIDTVSRLSDDDFATPLRDLQGTFDEWARAAAHMVIREIGSKADAIAALKEIAAQGEGPEDGSDSHFSAFLAIYQDFPDDRPDAKGDLAWRPAKPLLHNPNTTFEPSYLLDEAEGANERTYEPSRITERPTRNWAHLFNVRYRLLLTTIAHALLLQRTDVSPRTEMIDWCFDEMSIVAELLRLLATAPARRGVDASVVSAGAPFELPYSLALPDRERDRWLLHRDLLSASAQLIAVLREEPGSGDASLLDTIARSDDERGECVAEELERLASAP